MSPLPAAIDDCVAVVLWAHDAKNEIVQKHGDTNKIILLGDSAGASLADYVSQNIVASEFLLLLLLLLVLVFDLVLHFLLLQSTPRSRSLTRSFITP